MAGIKGRKAARGSAPVVADAGQGADDAIQHDAQRQSGGSRDGEPRQVAGKDWASVVALVADYDAQGHSVTQAYHPSPKAELIGAVNGNAQVFKGDARIVLSNGKRIPL